MDSNFIDEPLSPKSIINKMITDNYNLNDRISNKAKEINTSFKKRLKKMN